MRFLVKSNLKFIILVVNQLFVLDDCDKPEEPINGRVNWNSTTATYQCDPGFRLTNVSLIRRCTRGRWSGDPPACKLL